MAAVTSTIAAGITIAGGVAAGAGAIKRGAEAKKKDTLEAAKAAELIKSEQLALQDRETKNAKFRELSKLERVTDNIRNDVQATNMDASNTLFTNFVESTNTESRAGFAGGGTASDLFTDASTNLREKVDIQSQKIENTKGGIVDDFSIGTESISIADAKGRADIEQRFQARLGEIGSVADTFWEGVFGSDNEIEGYNYG